MVEADEFLVRVVGDTFGEIRLTGSGVVFEKKFWLFFSIGICFCLLDVKDRIMLESYTLKDTSYEI